MQEINTLETKIKELQDEIKQLKEGNQTTQRRN